MKYLVTLLLIGLVSIGVFGLSVSNMGMGHQGDCVASAIGGIDCPTSISKFAFHHISALQKLFVTMPPLASSALSWSLLFAVFLVLIRIFAFNKNLLNAQSFHFRLPARFREEENSFSHSRKKITSWLSLFELSPATL